MFYAYVIQSINFDYYYKGHCENQQRLKQHNAGMTGSIRKYIPFEIAYSNPPVPELNLLRETSTSSLLQEEGS